MFVHVTNMCNFIAKTGILVLLVFHFTSSLPFEADNELGGFEVKQLLSRLRRTPHDQESEEDSLESRFGGYEYDHPQQHEDFGNLHYSHRKNWHFNHGPPGGTPYWGDDHVPFCGHQHHHHHSHDGFPPQPWVHPPYFPPGGHNDHHSPDQPHRVLPGTKDAINPSKNKHSSVDENATDATTDSDQTIEKSTSYPRIDVRAGTRK